MKTVKSPKVASNIPYRPSREMVKILFFFGSLGSWGHTQFATAAIPEIFSAGARYYETEAIPLFVSRIVDVASLL